MSAFFLAFVACALAMLPGREVMLVARLSAHGAGWPAPGIAVLAAALASMLAAWLAGFVAPMLPRNGALMLVAFALGAAALETALRRPRRAPAEPTRSFGAIALVLLAGQVGDAARFLVFALAGFTLAPLNVVVGAVAGCAAAFILAWAMGEEWEARMPLRALRIGTASVLALAALACAATARGLIG